MDDIRRIIAEAREEAQDSDVSEMAYLAYLRENPNDEFGAILLLTQGEFFNYAGCLIGCAIDLEFDGSVFKLQKHLEADLERLLAKNAHSHVDEWDYIQKTIKRSEEWCEVVRELASLNESVATLRAHRAELKKRFETAPATRELTPSVASSSGEKAGHWVEEIEKALREHTGPLYARETHSHDDEEDLFSTQQMRVAAIEVYLRAEECTRGVLAKRAKVHRGDLNKWKLNRHELFSKNGKSAKVIRIELEVQRVLKAR